MEEKKYVNGMIIKEKVFDNGGTQLKLNIKTDDFIAQLKEMSENGWVNLTIAERREPSDKGATHYAYKNEFKPKSDDEGLPF